MILENKKGVMHISIVIFVIAVLLLTMTSLVVFNVKKSNADTKIYSGIELQKVYTEAEIVGFYLKEIASKADSAESFKILFNELKDSGGNYILPEFSRIAGIIDSSHITVAGNELKVNLDVPILESSDLYQVSYLYKFRYNRFLS